MDMVFLLGMRATYTKETTGKMKEKVMERCTGQMGVTTKEIGIKDAKKVKVNVH